MNDIIGRFKYILNKAVVLVLSLAALLAFALPLCAAEVSVAAASPWLCHIAAFIGGRHAKVRPLAVWNASGGESRVRRPAAQEIVIAFDLKEATRLGISSKNKKLRLLYPNFPYDDNARRVVFFDTASLPFAAHGIMKIFAEYDKKNYAYYQRRLAEYQSQIDAASDMGRHTLGNVKILDLTGAEGTFVRASVSGIVRPPQKVWESWLKGDIVALKAALNEAERRNWLILLDVWTPQTIRNAALTHAYRLTLKSPQNGEDYFTFLRNIFTQISDKIKTLPEKSGVK
ncbi:MAG: hypothetical protein Q4E17_02895 [Synergistes sp.]|nr:hypothetical protein [Synergistes sp.]